MATEFGKTTLGSSSGPTSHTAPSREQGGSRTQSAYQGTGQHQRSSYATGQSMSRSTGMLSGLETTIRNNPMLALGVAAGAGLLLAAIIASPPRSVRRQFYSDWSRWMPYDASKRDVRDLGYSLQDAAYHAAYKGSFSSALERFADALHAFASSRTMGQVDENLPVLKRGWRQMRRMSDNSGSAFSNMADNLRSMWRR